MCLKFFFLLFCCKNGISKTFLGMKAYFSLMYTICARTDLVGY